MDIQQINPKMISITKVRRDIDALKKVLDTEGEAYVMKNDKVVFVAIKPENYNDYSENRRQKDIDHALMLMDKMQSKYKFKGNTVSDYVIKMRDERAKKWKK